MRKIISLVMIAVLLICSVCVAAEDVPFYLTVKSNKSVVKPEETLEISLTVPTSVKIIDGKLDLGYDTDVLEYVSYSKADANATIAVNPQPDKEKVTIVLAHSGYFTTEELVKITFKVIATTPTDIAFTLEDVGDGIYAGDFLEEDVYENYGIVLPSPIKVQTFYTSTTATVGSEMVFITAVNDSPESGIIYAACYNGTTLVGCDYKVFNSAITEPVTFTMPVPAVYTGGKIFIWDADGKPLLETPENVEI